MNQAAETVLPVVGRTLMALIFLMSGIGKIFDFGPTTEYMASHGMPLTALFLVGAIVLEIAGGASLILGAWARWGAVMLIIFLVPATFIFHDFWTLPAAEQRPQMINFMKNLSILGALLMIVARGAGPLSVDSLRSKQTSA